jgi:dihydropteroate synthase
MTQDEISDRRSSSPLYFEVGGERRELTTEPLIMGILNRTPDSFYDKGSYFAFDQFLAHAEKLVSEGADIVDIGGVKAGPGPNVTEEEELDRVVPAVDAIAQRFGVWISVDTWNSRVLDESLAAGAHIGNDISGFADPHYLSVAAQHHAAVVATHIRLSPRVKDPDPIYEDLLLEVEEFLLERVRRAIASGVGEYSVAIDAGFDLGKTTEQSLELFANTDRLASHGPVVLISASNKGFLGDTLGLEVGDRRAASLSAVALSYLAGARIFRVHDVRGSRRVVDTLTAIAHPELLEGVE